MEISINEVYKSTTVCYLVLPPIKQSQKKRVHHKSLSSIKLEWSSPRRPKYTWSGLLNWLDQSKGFYKKKAVQNVWTQKYESNERKNVFTKRKIAKLCWLIRSSSGGGFPNWIWVTGGGSASPFLWCFVIFPPESPTEKSHISSPR